MELRDSFEAVASRASEGADAATTSVSEGIDVAREAASTGATAARDAATSNATTAREAAAAARRRVAPDGPAAFDRVSPTPDRLVALVRSASGHTERLPTEAVEPVVREYGLRTLALVETVDLGTTYRYGKAGFEYGGSYGRYVPFGNALPYVGLLAGLGAGVLDGADVVKVETLLDLTDRVPVALAEHFDLDVPTDLGATDGEAAELAGGPVGVTTDSLSSATEEATAEDYAAMEYDEFAGR
ncbi:hypothetical protein [Halomarina oriensis]|uniref:Uncharacterized protein n=1 Tax=Halomarina oriensis TaxID=671145 RepID=A0A6B0GKN7_9EURY|nr:hypothetical protein [Halomarina oriensis]MWG35180.1 hypothetical protein [Halomarina oriensis]